MLTILVVQVASDPKTSYGTLEPSHKLIADLFQFNSQPVTHPAARTLPPIAFLPQTVTLQP
ncbi:MAG: hypothetical protein ACLPY2_01110 [Bryobacteraceae bacterium]|jgi:hypothetical protein